MATSAISRLQIMDFETYALHKQMTGPIPPFRSRLMDRYVGKDAKVLDVGCGDGIYLEYMSRLTVREALCGTEASQIRTDRVRARGFNCHKVDSCLLPFDAGTFDVVTLFEVIEHLKPEDAHVMLSEIRRVLKPGGVLIGSTPNYPAKRAYDWVHGIRGLVSTYVRRPKSRSSIRALFADDPTHVLRLTFDLLAQLGKETGFRASLYRTFRNGLQETKSGALSNILTHKIAFVFERGYEGSGPN